MTASADGADASVSLTERLQGTPPRYLVGLLGLVGLAVLPWFIGTIDVLLMISAFYFVIFVISWDFVSGYTGQVSFGHPLLFAMGGYTTAVLNIHLGIEPLLSIPAGIVMATLGGLVFFGLPSLRLRGNYLVLVTLILPLIFLQIVTVYSDIFGGGDGMVSPTAILQMESFQETAMVHYYLGFVLFLAIFLAALLITRSNTGSVFTAIREDQEGVEASGISTSTYKLFAFTVSGLFGGIGGAVLVHTPVGNPSPEILLSIAIMIQILLASVVGGLGTITGPVVGGFLIYVVQDIFQGSETMIPLVNKTIGQTDEALFYVVMILLLFYLPQGLVPRLTTTGRWILGQVRGNGPKPATDGGRPEPPLTQILSNLRADMVETYRDVRTGGGTDQADDDRRRDR